MAETVQTLDWNTADPAAAFDGLSFTLTNDATVDADIQKAVSIINTNAAGATVSENLLYINNLDVNEAVTIVEATHPSRINHRHRNRSIGAADKETGRALAAVVIRGSDGVNA